MSVNTAHANNGVLIHSGESILLFSDNVTMEFSGQDGALFKGTKNGRIYLTTHRMIFNNKMASDPMQSFSFPFISISDVELEQPVFGSNYLKGKVRAQQNGNWNGETKFKLVFKSGGCIDFGQAMLRAARMAMKNVQNSPPPYSPPNGGWYEAPPPAYQPNPQGYYGWLPDTTAFPNQPPSGTVFMTDNPPPYPGIVPGIGVGYEQGGQASYPSSPPNYPGMPAGYPAQSGYPTGPPSYPQGVAYPPAGYGAGPPNPGYGGGMSQPGYPGGFGGYPGGAPQPGAYPGGAPQPGGYPGAAQPGFPGGFANVPGPAGGYPPGNQGAMGFSAPPQPNTKEAEAAQSAYYDPNQPQTAYVPPPPYYEPPPSYNTLGKKEQ